MVAERTNYDPVLVTGATGRQGGAVARALLAAGRPVRALVRDARSGGARSLEALGAGLVPGDLYDRDSLVDAATGARAVFSVQTPDMADLRSDSERVHGKNLVEAAKAAGVAQFVHTSVSGAGEYHRSAPGWKEGRWKGFEHYFESKAYTDEPVRVAGFAHWTILKPATFMENLVGWSPMFGNWTDGGFVTGFAADTWLSLVTVRDIGAAGAAIFDEPGRFDGLDIELAGDHLTMTEISRILSGVLGRTIDAPVLSTAEAVERGLMPVMVEAQEWMNEVGSPARPAHARDLGLATTDFETWANRTL